MALNNDVIDLTAAAAVTDEYVTGGRFTATDLSLDMNVAGPNAVKIPIPVTPLIPEKAGANYDPLHSYNTGDIVSVPGGGAYIALKPGVLGDPTTNPGDWINILAATGTYTETGGKQWDVATTFEFGDIISWNNGIYISKIVNNVGNQPDISPAEWELIITVEVGGKEWISTYSYVYGDVVIYNDLPYFSRTANTGSQPDLNPVDWQLLVNKERGGVLWDATVQYKAGDVVTDGAVPALLFIALRDNTGSPLPPGGGINMDWQELDSPFYNAESGGDRNGDGILDLNDGSVIGQGGVVHCPWYSLSGDPVGAPVTPNPLGEYPNTGLNPDPTLEHIGAVWYINGLGEYNDEPVTYTFSTGPLAGIKVRDWDKLIWIDGVQGSEIWLWSPFPRIDGERGGIKWYHTTRYNIGDIVTRSDKIWISIQGSDTVPNEGHVPDTSPTWWREYKQGGNIDGGSANSVYLTTQNLDGGGA